MDDELSMKELVHRAIDSVAAMVGSMLLNGQMKRGDLSIVVKCPGISLPEGGWSYEWRSFGNRARWQRDYKSIAIAKVESFEPKLPGYALFAFEYMVGVSCCEPDYEEVICKSVAALIEVPLEKQRGKRASASEARTFS